MREIINELTQWSQDYGSQFSNHPELGKIFSQCFINTLSTTTELIEDGTTYIFTGDIPAMWLRDSSAQVSHYLPLLSRFEKLKPIIRGLLKRQFDYILKDPYANAFNRQESDEGHKDEPPASKWVWERKYEIDSLCYPVWLSFKYVLKSGDFSIIDQLFATVCNKIMDVFETEQNHSSQSDYYFIRHGEYSYDTLPNSGKGHDIPFTGMTWSAFRPSDDRCEYNYLVPSNQFAVVILRQICELTKMTGNYTTIATRASILAETIEQGIRSHGIVNHPKYGDIYCYETDGKGGILLMDDANVPSLLSLPYLGYCDINNPIYKNTRNFILSPDNPFYFEGKLARGVGSPHTPKGYIWHIALIMQGLTSSCETEKLNILDTLLKTHADTGYMHESFDPNNPPNFTRPWFAWANSLFAVFIMQNEDLFKAQ